MMACVKSPLRVHDHEAARRILYFCWAVQSFLFTQIHFLKMCYFKSNAPLKVTVIRVFFFSSNFAIDIYIQNRFLLLKRHSFLFMSYILRKDIFIY